MIDIYLRVFFHSAPSFLPPLHPLLLSLSFPHKSRTSKITQSRQPLTVLEYTTLGSKFSLHPYTQDLPFLLVTCLISYYSFLVKSLSTATLMSLLSIFGFKCNAVNFFCCTWHITRPSGRTEVREPPITTQPRPQEPMNANPRRTPLH